MFKLKNVKTNDPILSPCSLGGIDDLKYLISPHISEAI
jgi:hypothetical protein